MTDALILTAVAFATSTFAAIVGLGGGMLLLAAIPIFLPASVIIPIHGATQLASNASRMLLDLRYVAWRHVPPFLLGSLLGLLLAYAVLSEISLEWLPLGIGLYILCHLWWPLFKSTVTRFENLYLLGAIQTGLGLLIGATGPLTTTMLAKRLSEKDAIVSTNALFMSFSHTAKLMVFGAMGFAFREYLTIIAMMALGAIFGSLVGTHFRKQINSALYLRILKVVLTVLALRMILLTLIPLSA